MREQQKSQGAEEEGGKPAAPQFGHKFSFSTLIYLWTPDIAFCGPPLSEPKFISPFENHALSKQPMYVRKLEATQWKQP